MPILGFCGILSSLATGIIVSPIMTEIGGREVVYEESGHFFVRYRGETLAGRPITAQQYRDWNFYSNLGLLFGVLGGVGIAGSIVVIIYGVSTESRTVRPNAPKGAQ